MTSARPMLNPPDFHALLQDLAAAELSFAAFNARRTGRDNEAVVEQGSAGPFDYLLDRSRPGHPYYNRAIARTPGPLPPEAIEALPGALAALELRPAQLDAVAAAALLAAGFHPAASLCYLALQHPPATADEAPGCRVERLGAAQVDLLFDLLEQSGVPFPAERRAAKRGFYCTPQFPAFVARAPDDGHILGWATMFVRDGSAFLGNAFTLPQQRGRGAHRALLAARLDAAARAGLRRVFTDVEHGSQSHRNCERAGLRTVTINTIWERHAG